MFSNPKIRQIDLTNQTATVPINQQEKVLGRKIKHALLRTQTSAAIHTKIEQAIVDDFKQTGSEVFINRLLEWEAYKSIVSYGCYIHSLETRNKKEEETKNKAIATAHDYVIELIKKLSDKASQ